MRTIKFRARVRTIHNAGKTYETYTYRWVYYEPMHGLPELPQGDYVMHGQVDEQFTGILDKNGVELAAGDKYKWLGWEVRAGKQIRPERIETIRNDTPEHWIEDCHRLWCISTGNSQGTIEVIGNIHDPIKPPSTAQEGQTHGEG